MEGDGPATVAIEVPGVRELQVAQGLARNAGRVMVGAEPAAMKIEHAKVTRLGGWRWGLGCGEHSVRRCRDARGV